NKTPVRQTSLWRAILRAASQKDLKDCHFSYTTEGMDALAPDQPALILMNHSSFTDLEIAATVFANRQFHIVTTLDGFVGKEWLLRRIGCIPARKFITDLPLVKDMIYCFRTLHSSVLMFPEASYSFDGTATALPESVGKSLKLFKVPVIMVTTEGAFHRDPLYNGLQKRDVTVTARVQYLLSPEQIAQMSVAELNQVLKEAFTFDHWRWQQEHHVKVSEPFRADGLERVLYRCPICGCETKMKGRGTSLTCHHCHSTWLLAQDGTLQQQAPDETSAATVSQVSDATQVSDAPQFTYVSDWYRWEREMIRKELQDGSYRLDIPVDILIVKDTKAAYRVGSGRLIHDLNGFVLTGCDGALTYTQNAKHSYSLYADYYWYEIGDMISIGDLSCQYYCFPKDPAVNVAKVRLATEELYRMVSAKQ
nr:1-acyl-sn-glycerol-3-phosphate acyltransferase [Lachnospiraceae bacterium]